MFEPVFAELRKFYHKYKWFFGAAGFIKAILKFLH